MCAIRSDESLSDLDVTALKSMVRLFGGDSKLRKEQCLTYLRRALKQPEQVRAMLARVPPFERMALGLVNQFEGLLDGEALALALLTLGALAPESRYRSDAARWLLDPLKRHGLIFFDSPYYSYGYDYLAGGIIEADQRILAQVEPPAVKAFHLKPAAQPASILARTPQAVALDLIGLLQAIENLGGLRLTKSKRQPTVRATDFAKLDGALLWAEKFDVAGEPFPNPTVAFLSALRHSDLLVVDGDRLRLRAPVIEFAERPYAQQVGALLKGLIASQDWIEWQPDAKPGHYIPIHEQKLRAGRIGVLAALTALPENDAFFSVDALAGAWFKRAGEAFTLGHSMQYAPYAYGQTPKRLETQREHWRQQLSKDWSEREAPWLARALQTWAYALGLVELGVAGNHVSSIRLSALGRACLHPALAPAAIAAPSDGPCWVVQPNFELVVYLDAISPRQLAFIERHAERVQADQHVAHYRLTRDSIYRGLESGATLDALLAGLQSGARAELPQNVRVELQQWAALREQVTLRRAALLAEFPDERARQKAIGKGLKGTPVGENFVRLAARAPRKEWHGQRIDYAAPLPACLSVTEAGRLTLKPEAHDLLLAAQLDQVAERIDERHWQLTAERVGAARKRGARWKDLLALLNTRLTDELPPWLAVALRGWAGEQQTVALAGASVLRCADEAVCMAIRHSRQLERYILAVLGPDALLVDAPQLAAFGEALRWAELNIVDDLVAPQPPTRKNRK